MLRQYFYLKAPQYVDFNLVALAYQLTRDNRWGQWVTVHHWNSEFRTAATNFGVVPEEWIGRKFGIN